MPGVRVGRRKGRSLTVTVDSELMVTVNKRVSLSMLRHFQCEKDSFSGGLERK